MPRIAACVVALLMLACAREPWVADVTTHATPGSRTDPKPSDTSQPPPEETLNAETDDVDAATDVPSYPAPIALDGEFEDWADVPALYQDEGGDAGNTGIDFTVLKAAHDSDFLYLYFETGATISLGSDQFLTLYVDTDNRAQTGYEYRTIGAELRWVFGQRGGKVFGAASQTPVQYADLGLRAGPTVTANRFEVALSRHAKVAGEKLFPGGPLALVLADHTWNGEGVEDGDAMPTLGERVVYNLSDEAPPVHGPVETARAAGARLRIVSWNSLYTGLLDEERAPAFRRILKALNPDVVCLQEAWYGLETAAILDEWLPLDEGNWQVSSFGNQVTLSRYPIVWGWPGGYDVLPAVVAQATVELPDGERLIVFNAHLAWGDQDEERQKQADAFIAFLRSMAQGQDGLDVPKNTPFIFLGDLNLVGEAQQLTTLVTGDIVDEETFGADHAPDWDDTDLLAVPLLQTERRMGYTWRADGGSYWPGRLDYALVPDSVVEVEKSFLLYTPTMSQQALADNGLFDGDSPTASDHLPLVLDLSW